MSDGALLTTGILIGIVGGVGSLIGLLYLHFKYDWNEDGWTKKQPSTPVYIRRISRGILAILDRVRCFMSDNKAK